MRLLKNKTTGTYFLGCSNWPKCRFTKNIKNPKEVNPTNQKCNKCNNFLYEICLEGAAKEKTCLADCLISNGENINPNKRRNNDYTNEKPKKQYKKNYNNNNSNSNNYNNNKNGWNKRKKSDDYEEDYL